MPLGGRIASDTISRWWVICWEKGEYGVRENKVGEVLVAWRKRGDGRLNRLVQMGTRVEMLGLGCVGWLMGEMVNRKHVEMESWWAMWQSWWKEVKLLVSLGFLVKEMGWHSIFSFDNSFIFSLWFNYGCSMWKIIIYIHWITCIGELQKCGMVSLEKMPANWKRPCESIYQSFLKNSLTCFISWWVKVFLSLDKCHLIIFFLLER